MPTRHSTRVYWLLWLENVVCYILYNSIQD